VPSEVTVSLQSPEEEDVIFGVLTLSPAYTGLKLMKISALKGCSPVPAYVKGL